MAESNENDKLRREIEGVLREHGIQAQDYPRTQLPVEEFRRVRDLALGIVKGDIDTLEISKLRGEMADELSAMVNYFMSLRGGGRLGELQEVNPYFSKFNSKVVRDGAKRKEE